MSSGWGVLNISKLVCFITLHSVTILSVCPSHYNFLGLIRFNIKRFPFRLLLLWSFYKLFSPSVDHTHVCNVEGRVHLCRQSPRIRAICEYNVCYTRLICTVSCVDCHVVLYCPICHILSNHCLTLTILICKSDIRSPPNSNIDPRYLDRHRFFTSSLFITPFAVIASITTVLVFLYWLWS